MIGYIIKGPADNFAEVLLYEHRKDLERLET